jgi:hypothetical protein
MSALEIIHLRSSGESVESLGKRIRDSIQTEGRDTEIVTLYRRQGLETDVAVHIHHMKPRRWNGPSTIALHLAHALRTHGLVEHTVWLEMTAEG